jgi:hypothetical protein
MKTQRIVTPIALASMLGLLCLLPVLNLNISIGGSPARADPTA